MHQVYRTLSILHLIAEEVMCGSAWVALLACIRFNAGKHKYLHIKTCKKKKFSKLFNLLLSTPPDAPQTDGDTDVCLWIDTEWSIKLTPESLRTYFPKSSFFMWKKCLEWDLGTPRVREGCAWYKVMNAFKACHSWAAPGCKVEAWVGRGGGEG